jgi:MFS family permease
MEFQEWRLDSRSSLLIVVAIAVGLGACHASVWGVMGSFYPELFGTRVRYSGASLGFQPAGIFGGAPAPLIATALFGLSGGSGLIIFYLAGACAVSALCYATLPETYRRDIGREEIRNATGSSYGFGSRVREEF